MDRDFRESLPKGDIEKLAQMKEKTTPSPLEGGAKDLTLSAQEGGGEGEKATRDYTRENYQNLMVVVELLDKQAPLPVTQRQIAEATGISKGRCFDICWNLVKRGWAEDTGDGSVRLKKASSEKDAFMGRMVIRLVRDTFGVDLNEVSKGN